MAEILLVNVVGTDRPGLSHALMSILAKHEVRVLDLGQAVIHDHLSLGMLLQLEGEQATFAPLKELLYKAHELGLSIRFTPVSEDEYEAWVGVQVQERNVITVLAKEIHAGVLVRITEVMLAQGLNIEKISRLSRRVSLGSSQQNSCLEFSVLGSPKTPDELREKLMQVTRQFDCDLAIQADDMYRRNRRLVVFDMDSTLIECEVIDELARRAGTYEAVAAITERAMQGELDFKSSFRERLAMLKGLHWSSVEDLVANLPLMEGAHKLTATLKKLGFSLAICSGGFVPFGRKLQHTLGIDHVFANELEVEDGVLTGRVVGEIVDGQAKAAQLARLADQLGISKQQTVAIGDGANDLPMIQAAGLGIAFRAKPIVREQADHALSVLGLEAVLYLLGVRDRDLLRQS